MEELILQKVNDAHVGLIDDFRSELIAVGDAMEGCGALKELSARDFISQCLALSAPVSCPDGNVVTTQFVCLRADDNMLVGIIKVRHYLNDFQAKFMGHIGYSVRPSERRKGYGSWMLRSILPYCHEIGLEQVLVCCEIGNEASQRTILSAGGVFEKEDYSSDEDVYLERYWIKT